MLSAGDIDAAVMSRLTAVSMADRFGLKNLEELMRAVDEAGRARNGTQAAT